MWVSGARFEGTCAGKILCMDWIESRDGSGGWLATGCSEGTIGVSWISNPEWSSHDQDTSEDEGEATATIAAKNIGFTKEASYYKSHFIIKGHLGEVHLVQWKPCGDRLASYDSWGRIIVWMNRANVLAYEFQIATKVIVTDFRWSPCGYYSLLCGRDGKVQLFSGLNGMNFFSVQIESTTESSKKAEFVCCAWNAPATRVALGTENGEIIIVDPEEGGQSVTTVTLGKKGLAVQSLQWFGPTIQIRKSGGDKYKSQGLSVYLRSGEVILFKSITCPECVKSKTGVVDGVAAWNSDDTVWAIVGYKKNSSAGSSLIARFLNREGYILYTLSEGLPAVPRLQPSLTNLTWALNNTSILLTLGNHLYSMELQSSQPSLQSLCREVIMENLLGDEDGGLRAVRQLPLPKREIERLMALKSAMIPIPFNVHGSKILDDLFRPISGSKRLHCVMESTEYGYILKYEYFNQYRALLNARRVKKGGFMNGGYQIEPAFDCSHLEQVFQYGAVKTNPQNWATQVEKEEKKSSAPKHHIFRQIKTAFKPGHRHGVTDVAAQERVDITPTAQKEPERPVIAEVEGSSITNRFRFSTSSHLFEDGYLGALSISTNYVKCKPRRITVHLSGTSSSSKEGKDEDGELSFEELTLHSKEPDWNNKYQIYELDFGGRVSQDSIKNFQIEKGGEVVMQFGKSDTKRFCLDFQAPFSPVQALCVALTCVL